MNGVADMKIGAIAPWFGGKRTLASRIVAELGPHASYWEPACGSLAVLLAKRPSSHETVNDLHGDIVNLAWVLQGERAHELYDRLQRTLMCEEIVAEAQRRLATQPDYQTPDLDRAYWFFVLSWAGRNGVSGLKRISFEMAVRWTSGGGSGATRFRNAVESIPAWHQRLRNVEILHRDLFDVLPRIEDQQGTVIYLDPPYFKGNGRSGCAEYAHEFTSEDHARCAREANRLQTARVIVSYYADPRLEDMYPGWTEVALVANKNLHIQNRRGASKAQAPEVLLINGPSYTAGRTLFDDPAEPGEEKPDR